MFSNPKKILFIYAYSAILLSAITGAQTAPDFLGARILVEAGDTAELRDTHLSTCNSADCRDHDIEDALAAESFCDTPPAGVEGAEGSCPAPATSWGGAPPPLGDSAALGCARFAVDRVSNPWHMDDPQKLCVLRQCAGGRPCFAGHSKVAQAPDLWNQGATLELPHNEPVVLGSGSDFHLWSVIRTKPSSERSCLLGSALHHFCVEPDRGLFLRLGSWTAYLSPSGALPLGTWATVEVSRSAGAVRAWVDGIEVTSGAPFNADASFVIGYLMSAFKGDKAFNGELAGLGLYDRELTENERQDLYQYLATTYDVGPAAESEQLTLDPRPDKYVAQRQLVDGSWVGRLTISGTLDTADDAGSAIEARVLNAKTFLPITAWQTVADTGDGAWTGDLTGITQGGWYTVELRAGGRPTLTTLAEWRFGVGAVIATLGQSNMVKLFTEDQADGSVPAPFEVPHELTWRYGYGEPDGYTYARPRAADIPVSWGPVTGTGGIRLANNLARELQIPVLLLDFSLDWTGLLQHWTQTETFIGWQRLASALEQLSGLEAVIWHQGAFDAHEPYAYENDVVTVDEHKAGLDALYAQITAIRPESVNGGPLPMLVAVQNRGVYDDVIVKDDAYNAVRRAQIEWVDERAHGFSAGNSIDLDLSAQPWAGSGHFWAADYQQLADRYSRAVLSAVGQTGWSEGVTGARITAAVQNGRRIQLAVSHDQGARLRLEEPHLPVDGFTVTDGEWVVSGARHELEIESASLSDEHPGNVVELVLAQEPSGPVKVRYLYGQNVFHDQPADRARANGNTLYDDFQYFDGRDGLPILPTTEDLIAVPVAGLEVEPEILSIPEGGSASFEVWLTQPATQTVTVSMASLGDEDIQIDGPSTLVFTPANSSEPQTVTVLAGADPDSESGDASLRLQAAGYESRSVTVFELDGDPFLNVSADRLAVSQLGGEASFQVALGVPITSGVRLQVQNTDPSRLTVIPTTLDFGAGDWSTPQTVTVSGKTGASTAPTVNVVLAVDDANSEDAYDTLEDVVITVDLLQLGSGLQLHWPLDEITLESDGSRWTPDGSGFNRHGTVGDQARIQLVGVEGTAIGTSGPGGSQGAASDAVDTQPFSTQAAGDQLSVVLWYALGSDKHDGYLFHWGGTYSAVNALSAYLDLGVGLRIRVHDQGDSTSIEQVAPPGFDQSGWHQLAVVKDAAGSRIFFDGEQVSASSMGSGSVLPALGFALGMNEHATFGSIADFDEVRIYDRALTHQEVAELFAQVADSTVTVLLGPNGDPADLGRWAVVDGSEPPDWHSSGESLELPAGPHTLRFDAVAGWLTPPDRELSVALGSPLTVEATYGQVGQGQVQAHLGPSEVTAEARWWLEPDSEDLASTGQIVTADIGTYSLRFSDVDGWVTPESRVIEILENETQIVWADYLDPADLPPIVHLELDEASGSIAQDSSGFGRHGTYGAQAQLNLTGVLGRAARTSSPGGSAGNAATGISVPDLAPNDTYDSATVAFWYRATAAHDGYLLHWGGTYNDPDSISIYLDIGQELRIRVHDASDSSSVASIAPPSFDDVGFSEFDGTWHHLVVTKSPSGTDIYFDGAHQTHHDMGSGSFTPALGLGLGLNEIGTYGADALFDDLRIYARALGAQEIAQLHDSANSGQLTVFLRPNEVAGAASWRLGSEPLNVRHGDGETVAVDVGQHTVIFEPVPAWDTPADAVVSLAAGQAVSLTGTYGDDDDTVSGLIVHLPLDELSGPTAIDISGNGHSGLIGSRMIHDLSGIAGRAQQTAGPGAGNGSREDGLEIPLTLGAPLQELSVSLWYRLPAEPHAGYLFNWGGSHTADNAISAYLDPGSQIRVRSHAAGDHSSLIPVIVDGFDNAAWHHLVLSKNTQGTTVFLDGELVAQSSHGAGHLHPADGFSLGMNEAGRYGLEATFDDVRLYDRALDAEDVSDLFHGVVRPDGFGGAYRTADQLRQDLEDSAVAHPDIMELVDFGDSWAKTVGGLTTPDGEFLPGDDLLAARITLLDTAPTDPERPVFVLMACLHAREIATPELAMRFLDVLLDGYGTDPDITWLVEQHEIWVLPLVNPDGHRMVEKGAEAGHGSRPWRWRKNARAGASCSWPPADGDSFGVDLNRNFPYRWGLLEGVGGAGDPCNSHYRGIQGGSEPETQALMSLISALIPDKRSSPDGVAPDDTAGLFIQLHSPLRTVAWPWANTSEASANAAGLAAIGFKLATFNGYPAGQAYDTIYPMSGTADDWVHSEIGAAAFLIEVGEGLMPAYNRVDNVIWPENRQALLYAAKIARSPYLTALGPDVRELTAAAGPDHTFDLTATADGLFDGTSNGGQTSGDQGDDGRNIAEVEFYVDDPPWIVGAAPFSTLIPTDGTLDSPLEGMSGSVDLSHLTLGRHTLFFRARNVSGVWGPISSVFVDLE